MSMIPELELNDGRSIPQLGFGVFQIDPAETAEKVAKAIEVGYRHIDTAQMYQNEEGTGQGIKDSGVSRDDIWLTTKLNNNNHEPEKVKASLEQSLEKLGMDAVDLFLIHWPLPGAYDGDYVSTWEAMIECREAGLAKSVGVSNFQTHHLEELASKTSVVPAVNQIEVHPYFANEDVRRYDQQHGIHTEAWSPIAQGGVLDDDTIKQIAEETGKTPAQVVLRWHIQRGDIIFPKTNTPSRMEENFDLFDFQLSKDHEILIDRLDKGADGRTGPHPDEFNVIPD
ncbi:aldo/keto reductase [Nocardioidaceae bacterium]|nr:aldo/keto reductase [Nocardioidaceae bacterium]